jgi:thioredoxin-like negative regulator of GroEL
MRPAVSTVLALCLAFFVAIGALREGSAQAAAPTPFTAAGFAAAQAEGKPIIVHVVASWCSTCAAQIPIVVALLQDPKYRDVLLLTVDFDTQKAVLRQFDVRAQSTFVVFKGRKEVARSTGETDRAAIADLFDRAS